MVAIPLEGALLRPVGIIHRRRKKFNRAAQCFLELLWRSRRRSSPRSAGGELTAGLGSLRRLLTKVVYSC